jgi:hypothetical protein
MDGETTKRREQLAVSIPGTRATLVCLVRERERGGGRGGRGDFHYCQARDLPV